MSQVVFCCRIYLIQIIEWPLTYYIQYYFKAYDNQNTAVDSAIFKNKQTKKILYVKYILLFF